MSISIPIKAAAEPISSSGGDEKAGAKGGDQSWRHIIHTCCEVGHISLVEELVESGLDIEKRDSAGNTPLHIAANAGHEEIMAYLLEKGCNVDAVNNAGWTAAHLATAKGHRGCLRLLLELNASPWARVNTSSL
ncbi:Ankyrin repeat-containing domain protein [Rhypophila decipiens]